MVLKIERIDSYLAECNEYGESISYEKFICMNESCAQQLTSDIFESYVQYKTGKGLIELPTFQKLRTFIAQNPSILENDDFEDSDIVLNENIATVIKSPIKYTKIVNNAKKLKKAKIAITLNDLDYEKKKAKSKIKDPDKNPVLKKANATKNDALKGIISDINTRIDDLATTDALKKVATVVKTKASLAANKVVLKSASGEESKQLKVKQVKLNKKLSDAEGKLKDYEKDAKAQQAEDKKDADIDKKIERAKSDLQVAKDEKAKLDAKYKEVKGTEAENAAAKALAAQVKVIKDIQAEIEKLNEK